MTPSHPPAEHDVLVFEHIPKTAGSTFRRLLRRRYGSGLFIEGARFERRPELDLLRKRILEGRPPRAISSHFGYGFHELLPGDLRYTHFTFLRDPVKRTISHYYYALERGGVEPGTSLREFCEAEESLVYPLRAWNFQTTFLSGLRVRATLAENPRPPRLEDHNEDLLAAAMRNLDAFPSLGLVERFEESLLLFGRTFGWPLHALCFVSLNRGKGRPARLELTDEDRAVLQKVNRLDAELYQHARERFEQLLAERVPDLPEQLRALRRMNSVYKPALLVADGFDRVAARTRQALASR